MENSNDEKSKKKKEGSRRRFRKVQIVSDTDDSCLQRQGNESINRTTISESEDEYMFCENSLLKKKLPANDSKTGSHLESLSGHQDLTKKDEQHNDVVEKRVSSAPDSADEDCLLVRSLLKKKLTTKKSKEGSNDADPERGPQDVTMEEESRQIDNEKFHEAGEADHSLPHLQQVTKVKRKKHIKGELCATDGCTEEVAGSLVGSMTDEQMHNDSKKYHEAGDVDHPLLQSNQKTKEGVPKSKVKRKKHTVNGEVGAADSSREYNGLEKAVEDVKNLPEREVAECGNKTVNIIEEDTKKASDKLLAGETLPVKTGDESQKGKSENRKKKRKRSEPTHNGVGSNTRIEDRNVDAENGFWKLSNGVIVEELEQGNPAGKIASHGKKLTVHYVGKLKGSEQVFDSNVGKAPMKFCLGVDEVTKGWSDGLDGVRVGGKRRLTIPPSLGNQPEGSWLIYEIEVVRIR